MTGVPVEPLVLDVREELKQGGRPMARILDAAKHLESGQDLVLLATFEPVPLYAVLRLRGFRHEAVRLPSGDWQVRFHRGGRRQRLTPPPGGEQGEPAPSGAQAPDETASTPWVRLDNRGLEPPEPMMRTLSALNALPAGQVLEIHNDRRPMFLYPHLTERGYLFQSVDVEDGSAHVRIWKPVEAGSDR